MRKSRNNVPDRTPMARGENGNRPAVPLTDRIFTLIQQQIQSGKLPPSSRLPSVRQLAIDHQVSNETAHRAYDKLVAHGYVEPRRGSGFYVKAGSSTGNHPSASHWAQQTDDEYDWRKLLWSDLPYERRPGYGFLPEAWMDRATLSSALRSLTRIPSRALAEYESPRGYLPLRQQLQVKLAEQGIHTQVEQIVTTAGAADALHLVLWSHVNSARNYVLVEDPAPPMHIQRALASGLEIARVARESDGPDIEAMRAICSKHRPRAFLCSSILQNPTSTNLSPHKAFQILKLADEFDFIVIDDDTYGDLLSPVEANLAARLATLDQLKRVIHIGSFSKTVAPGLRVGFIAASPKHIERIALYKSAGPISSTSLSERVIHQILSQGKYRHHCESLRARLLDIRGQAMAQLVGAGCTFDSPPAAGMYLWGSLGDGVDATAMAKIMLDAGYLMAPGIFFTFTEAARSYMRFNIPATFQSPAVGALRDAIRVYRRSR